MIDPTKRKVRLWFCVVFFLMKDLTLICMRSLRASVTIMRLGILRLRIVPVLCAVPGYFPEMWMKSVKEYFVVFRWPTESRLVELRKSAEFSRRCLRLLERARSGSRKPLETATGRVLQGSVARYYFVRYFGVSGFDASGRDAFGTFDDLAYPLCEWLRFCGAEELEATGLDLERCLPIVAEGLAFDGASAVEREQIKLRRRGRLVEMFVWVTDGRSRALRIHAERRREVREEMERVMGAGAVIRFKRTRSLSIMGASTAIEICALQVCDRWTLCRG